MTQIPQVSIIIPAKNEEKNIGFCLDSIFALDYSKENYEVIVVDNGSVDQTTQIAIKKGVQVLVLPGKKISTLRNAGSKQAKAEILAFLDADCTVERDWLQKAEKYFTDKSIVCFGSAPQIPLEPTWVQSTWYQVRKKADKVTETPWLESMNMFVRREIFEKIHGFNEKLVTCEDVDLSYRLSPYGKIVSDQSIKATHHGEAKNLVDFFRKERWRGKSNYLGLKEHGLRIDEIPSLILPLYFLFMTIVFFTFMLIGNWAYAIAAFVVWQLPAAGISLLKVYRASTLKHCFQLYFLYNVYFLARGLAVFI